MESALFFASHREKWEKTELRHVSFPETGIHFGTRNLHTNAFGLLLTRIHHIFPFCSLYARKKLLNGHFALVMVFFPDKDKTT